MNLFRSIATVGSLTACSRVLGFFRDVLIAHHLGATPLADAFFVAFKFPNFFRRIFAEGALSVTFVPLFSKIYIREGLQTATLVAEQIFSFLFCVLVLFVGTVEVFLPWLMYLLAPGFSESPEQFQLAMTLTRITFPYILLISMAAFGAGILNSVEHFGVGAASPILLNVSMIGVLLFFLPYFSTPAHGLAWAILGGGIFQYLWTTYALKSHKITLHWVWPHITPDIRRLIKSMVPGAVGAGIMQVNLLIDVMIASFLPAGAVSYLFYADRLTQLPLSIVGLAISTAMLPILSKHLEQQDHVQAREIKNRTLELSLFFSLPASITLIIFAVPILSTLFERGAFGHPQALEAGYTLAAYALGLPAYMTSKILSTSFFAQNETKTPVYVGTLCMILNILLNLVLIAPLRHVGIALATALSAWVNLGLLGWTLRRQGLFIIDSRLKRRAPRMVYASLMFGCVLIFLRFYAGDILMRPSFLQAIVLTISMGAGFVVYMMCSYFLRAIDLKAMRTLIQ